MTGVGAAGKRWHCLLPGIAKSQPLVALPERRDSFNSADWSCLAGVWMKNQENHKKKPIERQSAERTRSYTCAGVVDMTRISAKRRRSLWPLRSAPGVNDGLQVEIAGLRRRTTARAPYRRSRIA